MAENTMKLEVITPERSFYTGDVTFVELNKLRRSRNYAKHIPMTMIIAPGVSNDHRRRRNQEESGITKRIRGSHRNNHEYPGRSRRMAGRYQC